MRTMTTPTREQVIEWAKEAGFVTGSFNSIDPDEVVTDGPRYITDEIERLCALAMSAGRDQGLREAMEVCEGMHDEDRPGDYVAAIEQLEVK